jgi:hypothetical protein
MKTVNSSCIYWPRLWTMTDKRQTRPLVREGARTGQDRNFQTVNYYLVMSSGRGSTPRHTDWRTVSRKLTRTRTGHQATVETSSNVHIVIDATSNSHHRLLQHWTTSTATGNQRSPPVLHRSCAAGQATSHGRASSQLHGRSSNLMQAAHRASKPAKLYFRKALFRANTVSGDGHGSTVQCSAVQWTGRYGVQYSAVPCSAIVWQTPHISTYEGSELS